MSINIASQRLFNQRIAGEKFQQPEEYEIGQCQEGTVSALSIAKITPPVLIRRLF
ncbi:MAG TPA: hypothetical protein VFV38_02430 [Ktedonobacteraceae bacterium]|nr:hypothetical protein [Ktedonobacteraceae bacterium]